MYGYETFAIKKRLKILIKKMRKAKQPPTNPTEQKCCHLFVYDSFP